MHVQLVVRERMPARVRLHTRPPVPPAGENPQEVSHSFRVT